MRFVSARLFAFVFAFAAFLAVPVQHLPAQPAAESAAPAQAGPAGEQTTPSESTDKPEAAEKPAREGFGGVLDKFLENDFDATETAVNDAAASGDKRAATIIEALRDERLYFSVEQKTV